MHKGCGRLVHSSSTTRHPGAMLYTALQGGILDHAYKLLSYALVYTSSMTRLNHSCFAQYTTVTAWVIPTIHTPYKNHKNFLPKKYYLYKPELCTI